MGRRTRIVAGVTGPAAVMLYVGATALGGVLDPRYSQVRHAISELTASHAPHRAALATLYIAYNIVLTAFGIALARQMPSRNIRRVSVALFVLAAISGIGQVTLFPQDSTGSPATMPGATHIVLAAISAMISLAVLVLTAIALRADRSWRLVTTGSWVAAGLLVLTGPIAAANVGSPLMGLFERLTIGTFLAWTTLVSVACLRHESRDI